MDKKYDLFTTEFAKELNTVLNKAIANLNEIGIKTTKEELLNDITTKLKQIDEKKEEKPLYTIMPTTDFNSLPKVAQQNLLEFLSTDNTWTPLYIAEILKIEKEPKYYAFYIRTVSSNFITKRLTPEKYTEVINRPEKKDEKVFTYEKRYSINIK